MKTISRLGCETYLPTDIRYIVVAKSSASLCAFGKVRFNRDLEQGDWGRAVHEEKSVPQLYYVLYIVYAYAYIQTIII